MKRVAGAGVAVVHRGDEAGAGPEADAVIAGDVDDPAEVQRRVQDRKRLVLRHIDLVQDAEAARLRALGDGPLAQDDLAAAEGVGADQGGRVGVQVEGDVPLRARKHRREVLGQDVFPGGLRADEKNILPGKERRQRLEPDLLSVIEKVGLRDAALVPRHGVLPPKGLDLPDQALADALST